MSIIPLGFHGESLVALVVGGGRVATRRALTLLESGARVLVIAPDITPELQERSRRDANLVLEAREYEGVRDLANATIVIAATSSRVINDRVADDAIEARLPVNVADSPERSSFDFVATHRAGSVVVSVSAGGVPRAAQRIRDSIAQRIDERYAEAVAACASLRDRTITAAGAQQWNEISLDLIGPDFCEVVESGSFGERIARWA